MSREAEKKLLQYVVGMVGPVDVAKRLSVTEKDVEKIADGREWLSREQALSLAELIIEVLDRARA